MSETPRTDEAKWFCDDGRQEGIGDWAVSVEFACQLERELAQAQTWIEELEKDAARYKWLRVYPHNFFPEEENLAEEELDAAIDAALKEPR